MAVFDNPDSLPLYHGTKADLKPGDLIGPGYASNYGKRKNAAYVYVSATLNAATWGAELAIGNGPGRIYVVEATGPMEDDPNLTDKKFPGNPTMSYRTRSATCHGRGQGLEGTFARRARGDARSTRAVEAAGYRSDRGLSSSLANPRNDWQKEEAQRWT
jgi:hypothetical protein